MTFEPKGNLVLSLENVGGLFGRREFTFKPGVNLITAPNAAGKSSLIHGLQALVLDERDLSSRNHFVHAFERSSRVELNAGDGKTYVRRMRTTDRGLSASGTPIYAEGRKADLFCIASEDNELIGWVKAGKSLWSTLLDFSDFKYYEILGSYFDQQQRKAELDTGRYRDQDSQLKFLRSQMKSKEQELEQYERERSALPELPADRTARSEMEGRKYREAIAQHNQIVSEIASTEGEIQRSTNRLEINTNQEARLSQEVSQFETQHPDAEQELMEMHRQIEEHKSQEERLSQEMARIQGEFQATNDNRTRYMRFGGEKCFACGSPLKPEQLLDRQRALEKMSRDTGNEIAELEWKRKQLEKQAEQLNNYWIQIKTDLRRRLNNVSRDIALETDKRNKFESHLKELLPKRQEYDERVKQLEAALDKELRELLEKRRAIDEIIARTDQDVKTIKARIDEIGDVQKEIQRLQDEISFFRHVGQYLTEKAEEVKQRVKKMFNERITEVYKLLEFHEGFEQIYLDDSFKVKIVRKFQGRKHLDENINTLSHGEKETVALVLMLAGREAYAKDFPFFIADETTFYDSTRFKRIVEYISKRVPYTIITNLVPKERQDTLTIEYELAKL